MKLYAHQKKTLRLMAGKPYFADLSEPGTGKTLVQIENMKRNKSKKNLIICPKSIMRSVWVEQLEERFPEMKIFVLNKGSKAASKTLSALPDRYIIIVAYDTVPRILDSLKRLRFDTIILDESTKIKTARSQRSKAIIKLRNVSHRRYIMTGTPAPNGLMDVFNQYRFLNKNLFGESWFYFRAKYFEKKPWDEWIWYIKPGATGKIRSIMATCSVQHRKADCVDLPPLVFETREVEMTADQKRAYIEMKKDLIVYLESEGAAITAPFAVTKLMKLRQISSGFIYGDGMTYNFKENKTAALHEILDQINGKTIVFGYFRETLNKLYKELNAVAFTGKPEQIEEFRNGKDILLANPASAGHGLNLQFASNIIYYELDFNLENYLQSLDRINRIGQKNKMTIYHIIGSPIEKYILSKLKAKEALQKELDVKKIIKNI